MSQLHTRILIVDDTEAGREILGAMLISHDYELYYAINGQEALAKAIEVLPDLILLDVMMPDMDGFEVCRCIRQHETLAEVPIMMVTALDDRASRLKGFRSGADDFISKPFDTTELTARVQMITRLNRYHQLHTERRRFEQIIQFAPDGIIIVDEEGKIRLVNQTLLRLLKASDEEQVLGSFLTNFLYGDDVVSFPGAIRQVIAGSDQILQAEASMKLFDGQLLPVELVMAHFEWDERSMVQITIHDLGHRKQAEAALQASERRYRTIFDSAPVAIFEEDFYEVYCALQKLKDQGVQDMQAYLEGHPEFVEQMAATVEIRNMNAYARAIFRTEMSDGDIQHLKTIFLPESLQTFKGELLAIANGVRHYKAENIQKTLDGERRHVLISNLFPTEAEQFHEVLSTVVDITPLKLTNEALRASEDRYHKMMQMASDAIFVADMQTRMLVDVNDKAQQLVGRNREELLCMPISDLYPPHDQQSCSGTFIDRQRAQNDVDICEIMDSHGKRIPVEISTSCITLDERILCLGIFRDITERRKQERLRDATLAISVALRQAAERSEILPILLQQLLETLNAEGSAISHHEQQRAMFEQACGDWLSLQHESWLLEMEENTWRDEHPFAIYNQPEDRPDLPWLKGLSPGMAVMQAPLITREKVLGYLWVGREHAWEDTDGRILASVAELAANALQRVTFREELERRLEYLQALFKLDKAVAGNLDLNLIFRVLLEQVTSQLGVDAADVLLFRPDEKSLEFASGLGLRVPSERLRFSWDQHPLARQVLETRQAVQLSNLQAMSLENGHVPVPYHPVEAEQFRTYYGVPLQAKGQTLGVLEVFHRQELQPDETWVNFLTAMADQGAIAISQANLFDGMQKANQALTVAYDATIEGWALALELRDNETQGHSRRVRDLALRLANFMGIRGEEELGKFLRGAILHDIGKMGVPDRILHKPGNLNPDEWEIMKMHPVYAYDMLSQIEFLRDSLDIPLYHHERWDGSGYPEGLRGDQIPLSARIFAIVDVWDAVTNDRPYHQAWTQEEALAYLRSQNGLHFDPDVLRAFLQILSLNGGEGV